MKATCMLAFFGCAILVLTASAQESPRLTDTKIDQVFRSINVYRRGMGWNLLTNAELEADKQLLKRAEPDVSRIFRGVSSEDATAGLLWVWIRLRTDGEQLQAINVDRIINFAERLGSIDIKSRPREARIEIDGRPYPDATNRIVFETPGTHRIILRKEDYLAVDEKVVVEERKQTPFHRDLKRK